MVRRIKTTRLAEIYKAQKARGGGLGSTLVERAKEKIDPRQMFDQGGLLATMFPALFRAYKSPTPQRIDTRATSPALMASNTEIIGLLDNIAINTKMTAKSVSVLPSINRDTNITRQNIGKLVKLMGGKATQKTDMFFRTAEEREREYESKFKKEKQPRPTTSLKAPEKDESFVSMFLTFFKNLLTGLLAAVSLKSLGLETLVNLIKSTDTYKNIKSAITSIGDFITGIEDFFGKVKKTIFGIFDPIKEKLKSVVKYIDDFFKPIKEFFKITEETGGILSSLKKLFSPLVKLFEMFKGAINKIPFLMPFFALLDFIDGFMEGYKDGGITEGIIQGLLEIVKGFITKPIDLLKDIISWISEKLGFQNFSKWLDSFSVTDIFEKVVYTIRDFMAGVIEKVVALMPEWMRPSSIKETIDKIRGPAPKDKTKETPTTKKETKSEYLPTEEVDREMKGLVGKGKPTPAVTETPTTPTKTSGIQPLLDAIAKGESGAYGYEAMNQGTIKGKIIGSGSSETVIGQKLTDMTVGEIMSRAAKKSDDAKTRNEKGLIFAAGRYQIVPDTLKGLVDSGVVSKDEKFSPEVQDRLAIQLLKNRGVFKLVEQGKFEEAQNVMGKEWASTPMASEYEGRKTGESYWGGPNKASSTTGTLVASALRGLSPSMADNIPKVPGTQLASASTALATEQRQITVAPVTINAPNVPAKPMQQSAQFASASAQDYEFITRELLKEAVVGIM